MTAVQWIVTMICVLCLIPHHLVQIPIPPLCTLQLAKLLICFFYQVLTSYSYTVCVYSVPLSSTRAPRLIRPPISPSSKECRISLVPSRSLVISQRSQEIYVTLRRLLLFPTEYTANASGSGVKTSDPRHGQMPVDRSSVTNLCNLLYNNPYYQCITQDKRISALHKVFSSSRDCKSRLFAPGPSLCPIDHARRPDARSATQVDWSTGQWTPRAKRIQTLPQKTQRGRAFGVGNSRTGKGHDRASP